MVTLGEAAAGTLPSMPIAREIEGAGISVLVSPQPRASGRGPSSTGRPYRERDIVERLLAASSSAGGPSAFCHEAELLVRQRAPS